MRHIISIATATATAAFINAVNIRAIAKAMRHFRTNKNWNRLMSLLRSHQNFELITMAFYYSIIDIISILGAHMESTNISLSVVCFGLFGLAFKPKNV